MQPLIRVLAPCLLAFAPPAQVPALVADVNATPLNRSSAPEELVVAGTQLFLTASTPATGAELYVSSGAPGSTRLVRDLIPGPQGSTPRVLTAAGNQLFFVATDTAVGVELWTSDGTATGTALVKDINPGSASSVPWPMVAFGNAVLFGATTPQFGTELWISDGTASGTRLLKDLIPGPASGFPNEMLAIGNTVYFTMGRRDELWRTDGTTAGTSLVATIPSFGLGHLAEFAGQLYFSSNPGTAGELWTSDGTAAGTVRIATLAPNHQVTSHLATSNNLWLATSSRFEARLYASDGTTAGTRQIAFGSPQPFARALLHGAIGTRVLFSLGNATLQTSDGTPGGTYSLPATITGTAITLGTTATFAGGDSAGVEPWRTDGTIAGTWQIVDLSAGVSSSLPRHLTLAPSGTAVLFAANDRVHGEELWSTAGTAASTVLADDIDPPVAGETVGAEASGFVDAVGTAFFAADDGITGLEPWRTDTTAPGTALVAEIWPAPDSFPPVELTPAGTRVFFVDNDGAASFNYGLYVTDGTPTGTLRLREELSPQFPSAGGPALTAVGERVFLRGSDGINGTELWVSDGTEAGTRMVRDINPGLFSPAPVPQELTAAGQRLFFVHDDEVSGAELWVSDGTEPGTTLVADLTPGAFGSGPSDLVAFGDGVLFASQGEGRGVELWRSDGTAGGTKLVADVRPGSAGSAPRDLTVVGDRVFFSADNGSVGRELWVTGPGATGAQLVANLTAGASGSQLADLTGVGDQLFFTHGDSTGGTGRELWVSDGTELGTRLVRDIRPGTPSSAPADLAAIGTRWLWFSADDGVTGRELWRSDGTAVGTVQVADLNPGAADAAIADLILTRGRLLLAADDGKTGVEPFALFPGATAQAIGNGCGPPTRTPRLSATDPVLGGASLLQGHNIQPGAATYLALGFPRPPLRLPSGCLFHLEPASLAVLAYIVPTGAQWTAPLPIPNLPALRAITLAAQAIAGPTGGPGGLDVTNAVYLTFGD
ncbi:MAG: ELWxxDGT repeat protein [Planctomycetota bacterium]